MLFKGLLIGQWHGLPDPKLERARRVQLDFMLFCGLGLHARVRDQTTRYRNSPPWSRERKRNALWPTRLVPAAPTARRCVAGTATVFACSLEPWRSKAHCERPRGATRCARAAFMYT